MDTRFEAPDRDNPAQDGPGMLPSGTVTFLFTDIEGSTRLLEQLREEYSVLLGEQRDLLRAAFAHWQGHEIDTQGDSFFVAFTRAIDAIGCVIEAQRALASHAWPQGVSVRVRMGLHTGEPMVARTGYIGMDVHRAARVAAAGHGGQVLLSQTTRELVYQELPPEARLRSLGEHKLKDIRFPQHIYQLEVEGLPSDFPPLKTLSLAEEPPTPGNPAYKGLQYFDEADAAMFFGRSLVTARLVEAINAQHFLAVIGASGSGKSSTVRAGLVPALKHKQPGCWEIFVLTPTAQPLESLAVHLTRAAQSVTASAALLDDLRRESRSLHLYARKQGWNGKQWLLVVDQFEELFTLCREEEERRAFIENILQAVQVGQGRLRVLITLRADFYEHLAAYPGLRDAVAKHQEYLGAMSAEELREVIEEPAKLGGWEFAPGLVELMLHEIGAEGERQPEPGALPLLSHALLETWNHRRGNLMNLKSYGEAGGVNRAIARTAERLYAQELTPAQQEIARSIFLRLTELGEGTQDTRRRAGLQELFPRSLYGNPNDVEEVLVKLADARLIITEEGTVEVAHEALIREWPTLREWLKDNREGLLIQRRLTEAAQEWQLLERDPSALYRGVRLAQAVEWAQAHPQQLNAQEQAFLDASQAEAQREETEREAQRQRELDSARQVAEAERQRAEEQARSAQRLRRRAVYLRLALLATLALVVVAVVFARRASEAADQAVRNEAVAEAASTQAVEQRQAAEDQKQLAQVREWIAASVSNLTVDPERSILLAMQAVRTLDLPEGEQALHNAILASRLRDSISPKSGSFYIGIAIHPDGKHFATENLDHVEIWALDPENFRMDYRPLLSLNNPVESVVLPGASGHTIEFSPNGSLLAAVSAENTIRVWDYPSGKLIHILKGHDGLLTALAFSPDNKLLVTSSYDTSVRVWDMLTGDEIQILKHESTVMDVAFQADGKQLFTSQDNNILTIWNRTENGKEPFLFAYRFDSKVCGRIAISLDQEQMAVMLMDINLFDLTNASAANPPRLVHTLYGHNNGSYGLIFNKDGSILYSASSDSTIRAWDTATGRQLYTLLGNAGGVTGIALSQDGTQLLAVSSDAIKLWDVTFTGNREWFTLGPLDLSRLRMISPDGKYLAVDGVGDDHIRVWELSENGARETRAFSLKKDAYTFAATDRDFQRLVVYYSETRSIEVIDMDTGTVQKTVSIDPDPENWVIALSPDGSLMAFGLADGTTKVYDLNKGARKFTLQGQKSAIYWLNFSPDGRQLATPSVDGTVDIWDMDQGKLLMQLEGSIYNPVVAYSADSKRLLVSKDRGAVLYDLQTGKPILTVSGTSGDADWTAVSPDNRYLAVSSLDSVVTVFDGTTGKQLVSFPGNNVTFTLDSKHLITSSYSTTLGAQTFGFDLETNDLLQLAHSRLTRTWTLEECRKFLHMETCPIDQ